ncbi:undecaprenyl-diphosphatase [Herbaspirillum sp.]|uniref:undecaprenyl-diphosphatase n=1 Tax=Herbaspirillum sp. TaxID=1890675 RepID=UPI0025BC893C|nr:undecaprenyl-diphosphatase [Herbaspirillum sp.]
MQINAGADTPGWQIGVATGLADYLIYLIPLCLLGAWLWGGRGQRLVLLNALAVTMIALGVNQLIGLLWTHPRPFMIGLGHTWIAHAADSSFPSDHVTVFASVGLSLLLGGMRVPGLVTLLLGMPVAWARIFLGVHFPLDMAGAVVVAAAVCLLAAPAWRSMGGALTDLCERLYRKLLSRPIAAGWFRA